MKHDCIKCYLPFYEGDLMLYYNLFKNNLNQIENNEFMKIFDIVMSYAYFPRFLEIKGHHIIIKKLEEYLPHELQEYENIFDTIFSFLKSNKTNLKRQHPAYPVIDKYLLPEISEIVTSYLISWHFKKIWSKLESIGGCKRIRLYIFYRERIEISILTDYCKNVPRLYYSFHSEYEGERIEDGYEMYYDCQNGHIDMEYVDFQWSGIISKFFCDFEYLFYENFLGKNYKKK